MSSSFLIFLTSFCTWFIPLLVQLFGVIGFGKAKRDKAWWFMIAGTASLMISTLVSHFAQFMMVFGHRSGVDSYQILKVSRSVGSIGLISFVIGFAMRGWQGARMKARIEELELLSLAQATELERLRNR